MNELIMLEILLSYGGGEEIIKEGDGFKLFSIFSALLFLILGVGYVIGKVEDMRDRLKSLEDWREEKEQSDG